MSEYIKFNNKEELVEVNSLIISNTVINGVKTRRVTFNSSETEINLSGFAVTNKKGRVVNGDCLSFKYLYRDMKDINGTFILTDNSDDVYEEPEPAIPDPPTPPDINSIKLNKKNSFSSQCEQRIVAGVDVNIDGKIEHFSYDIKDQANIEDLYLMVAETEMGVYYHADGCACKLYEPDQIAGIWALQKANKNYHTTYNNQLAIYLSTLEDLESVNNTYYGMELQGEYLELLNAAVARATEVVIIKFTKDFNITQETAMDILMQAQPGYVPPEPEPIEPEEPVVSDIPVVSDPITD